MGTSTECNSMVIVFGGFFHPHGDHDLTVTEPWNDGRPKIPGLMVNSGQWSLVQPCLFATQFNSGNLFESWNWVFFLGASGEGLFPKAPAKGFS